MVVIVDNDEMLEEFEDKYGVEPNFDDDDDFVDDIEDEELMPDLLR